MPASNVQYSNFLNLRSMRGTNLATKTRSDTISQKPIFSMDFTEKILEEEPGHEEKTMGKDEFNVFLKIYFELILDVLRNQTTNIS